MAVSLTNAQKVMITAQALDASGNAVAFVEAPVFSVGNNQLAQLVQLSGSDTAPALPGLAMWLVPIGGQEGTDTVSVSENAVAGDSGTLITGTLDYTVTQGVAPEKAATIEVSAGAPVDAGIGVQPIAKGAKRK